MSVVQYMNILERGLAFSTPSAEAKNERVKFAALLLTQCIWREKTFKIYNCAFSLSAHNWEWISAGRKMIQARGRRARQLLQSTITESSTILNRKADINCKLLVYKCKGFIPNSWNSYGAGEKLQMLYRHKLWWNKWFFFPRMREKTANVVWYLTFKYFWNKSAKCECKIKYLL